MSKGYVNVGEFTERVSFKRQERRRTSTGSVEQTYVDAGVALAKVEQKTLGETVDDTKVALESVIQLTTYILTGVDNTYRVVVRRKEYEITGVEEVKRRYMVITAKLI